LLDNAIQYGPEGTTVTVAVTATEDHATVTVTDHGPGIPVEHRDRIFDRFYRVDPSRARGGVGLGLAIARDAVEAHRGHLGVESEIGRGSTFRLTLPRSKPTPSPPSLESGPVGRR
jgi:signal transduction histidine kinase